MLANRQPNLATDIIVEMGEHENLARAITSALFNPINKVNVLALHYADLIICVSRRQRDILISHISSVTNKVLVMYNPLPPIYVTRKELAAKPLLLYLGGSSYVKGFHIITGCLSETLKNCKLILVYDRILVEKLEKFYRNIKKGL